MTPLDSTWLGDNPLPQPGEGTDKNSRGRVLAAGGAEAVPGALRLTGEAALRAGAGKLQLATVERAAIALGLHIPEAAVYGLPANACGELSAEAGVKLCSMIERCDALVFGPGMGADAAAEAILAQLLDAPRANLSLVLDAAAIPAASKLASALARHDGRVVLTPHPGEMARLMDCDEDRVAREPEALVAEAAARFDAVILLKGPRTLVACAGEAMLRYPGGGVGLATGGSGDVLAGIIAGLLARGAAPRVAAAWGVWLHGEAGRRVAERSGPLGFLARELLPEIPSLMALGR